MGSVVMVARWGRTGVSVTEVREKMRALDSFIRSRIEPPPVGSVVFNFAGGRVTMTGDVTQISSDECEVMVQCGEVIVSGAYECASAMHCAIHREIEELRARAAG